MAITVAQLQVKVGGDTAEAENKLKGLNSQVNESGGFFKNALSSALGFAAGAGAIAVVGSAVSGLTDFIGGSIQAGIDQEKVMTQTAQVIKSTGGAAGVTAEQVGNLADSLARTTPFADDVTQSAENMLLTFTNIGSTVFPQATKTVLDMSQALGQDTKSSAIQLGKALNDPIAGISALSRVGVTFDAQQKATIKTMMAANDIAGAQGIILKELSREFGGSAEAAGTTFAGKMAILNNTMDQTKEKIGLALIPILDSLMSGIQSKVLPVFDKFATWFMKDGIPAISKLAGFLQAGLIPMIEQLFIAIGQKAIPIFDQFAKWITTILVPAAIQMFGFFQQNILPVLKDLVTVIMTTVLPALERISAKVMNELMPALIKLWQHISPVLIPVMHLLGWVITNVVGPALGAMFTDVGIVIDVFSWLVDKIADVMTWFINLGATIGTFVGNALGSIGDFIGKVLGFFGSIPDKLRDAGVNWIKGLINGITSMAGSIKDAVGKTIGDAVHNIPVIGGLIPGFAMGTSSAPGGMAIVGENGPELVMLPQGSQVIPNSQTRNLTNNANIPAMQPSNNGQQMTSQTITIMLDGRQIARTVLPHMASEIRLATGIRS